MKLESVLKGLKFKTSGPIKGVDISAIRSDSRSVRKGDLFIAFRGYSENGYRYIDDAIKNSAGVIIAAKQFRAPSDVLKISVADTRQALPAIAGNFYGHPSKDLAIIGVTGTNGKTSITYILESILKSAGSNAGVIGTINYRYGGKVFDAKNTTPGPIELQSMLSGMREAGLRHALMEVSSHALDQQRIAGILFDAAVFTNVTSEHLDYHKKIDRYFKAKVKIFDNLKKNGFAVLNADDDRVLSVKKYIQGRAITYGIKNKADVRAENITLSIDGSSFTAVTPKDSFRVNARLIGMHNVSNILASIAVSCAMGISSAHIKKGAEAIKLVPGRLEPVGPGKHCTVFVDYAHTEDALDKVLRLLKKVARSRIITVFGCGGNRDKSKRPMMGRAACRHSDSVIITSDNPRFEDPRTIIDEIEKGVKARFSNYEIVSDRRKAIERAICCASPDDIVIIAGKGHETCQIIKDKVLPFDDREVARNILKRQTA